MLVGVLEFLPETRLPEVEVGGVIQLDRVWRRLSTGAAVARRDEAGCAGSVRWTSFGRDLEHSIIILQLCLRKINICG